jgi:hypothetical protein
MTKSPNAATLAEITRAAIVPIFIKQIEDGWHDFQLDLILKEKADPRLVSATLKRAVAICKPSGNA